MNARRKARGFGDHGSDIAGGLLAAKRQIMADKAPDLTPRPKHPGYFGSDSATPEEANSVPPGSDAAAEEEGGDSSAPKMLTLSEPELAVAVTAKARAMVDKANENLIRQQQATVEQLAKERARAEADRARFQQEVDAANAEAERLRGIFNATGTTIPVGSGDASQGYGLGINILRFPSSREPQGAAKDFVDMMSNPQFVPVIDRYDRDEGHIRQRNTSGIDTWLRNPRNREHALRDFDVLMKANGLFQGGGGRDASAGPTRNAPTSIPDYFLDFLSAFMRTSHVHRFVWWQFPVTQLEIGQTPGQTVKVPRFDWLDAPQNLNDYILDDGRSAAAFNTQTQGLSSSSVPITVKTYGLGLGTNPSNRVLSITEMVMASNLASFMTIANTRLVQNYRSVEDLAIREIFESAAASAANIYYNDGGALSQDPLTIIGGNDGTVTDDVLGDLAAEMDARRIPTFDNGKRAAVLCSKGVASLRKSMGDKLKASTQAEIYTVMNVLNAGTLGDGIQQLNGYIGDIDGFMLFNSTELATGPVGSRGVTAVTTGAGSQTFRDNFFFGPGVAGHAESSPFEVVEDSSGTFGTRHNLIWKSTEGWGAMDCSAHLGNGQQTRVVVLRGTDRPL